MTSGVWAVLLSAATSGAGDWPQWRGPDRDGIGRGLSSAGSWPAELQRRWYVPVGSGQSSPVFARGRAYLFTREGEVEVARALDVTTGRVVWRRGYRAPYRAYPGAASYGSGPKSTPVLYGEKLFTLGIGGTLTAFDVRDGHIAWQSEFSG